MRRTFKCFQRTFIYFKCFHLKTPWFWERLKAGGEGDNRGWNGWMASPTQWTWVWTNSERWWRAGKPGMLQSMGSQKIRHDWMTELTEMHWFLWLSNITLYMYVPQLLYPFIYQWTYRLLPCPRYHEYCCDEHWGTCAFFQLLFSQGICPIVGLFCHMVVLFLEF